MGHICLPEFEIDTQINFRLQKQRVTAMSLSHSNSGSLETAKSFDFCYAIFIKLFDIWGQLLKLLKWSNIFMSYV